MKFNVQDLIDKGLVVKKTYTEGKYKGLSVLKYHRKVFYKNLWHLDDRLLECRGTVVDEDWNVIVLPFRKVFNYGENGTTVDPERKVIVPTKINGFMAAATLTEKYGLIVSTTGSLDSDFAVLARKWIESYKCIDSLFADNTFLFEICDESDPHIVYEEPGAYFIGLRQHNGKMRLAQEETLDIIGKVYGFPRPTVQHMKFKDIPETMKEGFMVRDWETEDVLCKLKSSHYLSKKCLMRVGKAKVDDLYGNPEKFKEKLDEEFYGFVDYLTNSVDVETWRHFTDQERRTIIEEFYKK